MSCAKGCCESAREHYLSVSISAAATPTRSASVVNTLHKDKAFERDAAAYRRLRKDGLQPSQVDGSAAREATASTPSEVER